MKRTVYLWLLLCLPYLLPAQGKSGYFSLKPGDWFDMQITKHKDNDYYPVMEPLLQFQRRYVLRYRLQQQLPNGNQQYSITLERSVLYTPHGREFGWMAYDSYYPAYKQGLDKAPPKGKFQLEITAGGEIKSLATDKDQPPLPVTLAVYSPQKQVGMSISSASPSLPLVEFEPVIKAMLQLRGNSNNGIPCIIPAQTVYQYSQLLTGASFPITGNTLIKGTLAHAHEKQVKIELGDSTYTFPINSRGEFQGYLTVTQPQVRYLSMENNGGYVFMTPGDTLIVEAEADTSRGSQPWKLSGSAKWSSLLANDAELLFYYGNNGLSATEKSKTLQEILFAQEEVNTKFKALLQTYEGKASPVSIDYYKTNWQYRIANDWLLFLYTHGYKADPQSRPFQGIPDMITAGIDTMPVVMNRYHDNYFYQKYLDWFLIYQQSRIGLSAGGSSDGFSFYSDYFALLSVLKGYPLYYKLSKAMSQRMKEESFTKNQRLKPYFEDFIHNCDDSSIIKPIIKDWQFMERWAPGNALPFPILSLANGKTYDLKTHHGKTTCVIFDDASYFQDTALVKIVKQHPEVSFVYAWISEEGINRQRDPAFSSLPNFRSIEIKNRDDKNYEIYGIPEMGRKNVIVLDQWGKITADHIYTDDNVWKDLGTAIDDAAKAPRFSAVQKAGVMNILGWSLGSILFTALVGIWIYRVRIRRIKQAEAMKTTIRELEIKAIRSQMNPHFIFNALNSIQSLINTTQYKAANTYLVKFSLLLRNVLHHAEKNTITLSDELATIRLYCELEQLRFNFVFEMDTPETLATDLVEIPGMILQPLVENAILHGIASKGATGLLRISVEKQNAALQIAVYDNGAGYHPEARDGSHKSRGLKLVQERLQLFSIAGQTGHLHISNGNGTTALLTIPIESI